MKISPKYFIILGLYSLFAIYQYYKKPAPQPIARTQEVVSVAGDKSAGFASQSQEFSIPQCRVTGTIPSWLKGSFIFTGPAQFELGSSTIKYLYNALGMIHHFKFFSSTACYQSKHIPGVFRNHCTKQGHYDPILSHNGKKPSFFSRVASALGKTQIYDNANMNVVKMGTTICALTETPDHIVIDPQNLGLTPHSYADSLTGHLSTAQPLYDRTRNCLYNLLIEFGNSSSYELYRQDGNIRTSIWKKIVKKPSYMRCFAMTEQYCILMEVPFVVNPVDLALSGESFIDNFVWEPKLGTTMHIIHKDTGTHSAIKMEPFFNFTALNAYEDGNRIIIDAPLYQDAQVLQFGLLHNLRKKGDIEYIPAYLNRLTVDLQKQSARKELLCGTTTFEMGIINPNWLMKKYTYAYGLHTAIANKFPNTLIKIALSTQQQLAWSESGCFPGRPIFIPKPKSTQEDDGIIASLVFDSTTKTSFLVLLNAQTMKEVARIQLDHHIPLGAIGNYFE